MARRRGTPSTSRLGPIPFKRSFKESGPNRSFIGLRRSLSAAFLMLRQLMSPKGEITMKLHYTYSSGYLCRHTLYLLIGSLLPATLFAQQPIDQWNFDETSGSVAYNSVAGRANGMLSTGASFVPAITGNGVNLPLYESVDFGTSTGQLGTSDFTISFWLKTAPGWQP